MLSLLFCFRPEIILKKTPTSEWPEEFHWNFFENMYLMIILEATKKQVFAVSLEHIFLEKQERSQIEAKWNQINCLLWNLEFDFTQICWIWYWWPQFEQVEFNGEADNFCFRLDRLFLGNPAQKDYFFFLNWNLVPEISRLYWARWWCSLFLW